MPLDPLDNPHTTRRRMREMQRSVEEANDIPDLTLAAHVARMRGLVHIPPGIHPVVEEGVPPRNDTVIVSACPACSTPLLPDVSQDTYDNVDYCRPCIDNLFPHCVSTNRREPRNEQIYDEYNNNWILSEYAVQIEDGTRRHMDDAREVRRNRSSRRETHWVSPEEFVNYQQCRDCDREYHDDVMQCRDDDNGIERVYCPQCFNPSEQNMNVQSHSFKPAIAFYHREDHRELIRYGSPHQTVPYPMQYFGVELEYDRVQGSFDRQKYMYAFEKLGWLNQYPDNFMVMKYDGSLNNGLEFVTQPFTKQRYLANKHKLVEFLAFIQNNGATTGGSTGLHIHLSRASLSEEDIAKLYFFINTENNQRQMEIVAGRDENQRCKYHRKNKGDTRVDEYDDQERSRYQALNFMNTHTLEIRIFRSSYLPYLALGRIEFTICLVEFIKQTTRDKLNFNDFVSYMQDHGEYQYLQQLFAEKQKKYPDFLLPYLPKENVSTDS